MAGRRSQEIAIGFAAGDGGTGVAYAAIGHGVPEDVVRVPFAVRRRPALNERDVAYEALVAVAAELLARGLRRVSFRLAAPELIADLEGRRAIPQTLTLPYVTLRCRLNRFAAAEVLAAGADPRCRDLAARARAEVGFAIAA